MDVYVFVVAFLVLVLAVSLYYNFSHTRRLTTRKCRLRTTPDRSVKKVQFKEDAKIQKDETGKRKAASTQSDFGSSVKAFQGNYELGSEEFNLSEDEMDAEEDDYEHQTQILNEEIWSQDIRDENEYNIFRSFVNEDQLTKHMQEFGIFKGLCHYVADNVEDWKEKYVKIAIAGNSGTGKSSLINTLRGMRPGDKGAAKVGVTETTTEAVSYRFPNNDRIRIFDLPGMGTINFPRQNYMEDMKVSTYDAFIIVTSERITENDVWFTKEIMSKNRHVCFVRTKIDTELANEKKDNPKGFVKEKCLAEMRNEIITTLKKELGPEKLCGIYLLSSRDKNRYDFPKLTDALQSHLNILGRAIRKILGEHIKLVIDEKRELNKGGFLPQKIWAFMSGFSVPHTHNSSGELEKIRLICLREFCLDNMSLELVSNETGISVDDLKAKLRTFKQDEDKAKKSGFQRVTYVMRYYHAMQRNLANMCDDMASDEMCLVNLKLDRVEEELSLLLSK